MFRGLAETRPIPAPLARYYVSFSEALGPAFLRPLSWIFRSGKRTHLETGSQSDGDRFAVSAACCRAVPRQNRQTEKLGLKPYWRLESLLLRQRILVINSTLAIRGAEAKRLDISDL